MNVNQDQLFSALKKDVRSLLVSAKFGLAPEQLKRDYQALVGHPVPLRALGFRYILDMVKEMPDVVYVDYAQDGNIVLKAVGDETTRGIQDLVAKQKTVKRKPPARQFGASRPYYPQSKSLIMPRRVNDPPALPAHLRSQLRQLLSQGPLRLSELEKYYTLRFGRRLQPESYGYYSLTELLSATADFITVEQSRSGSLLKLKSVITPLLLNPPRAPKQEVLNSAGKLPPNPVCKVEASKERVPVMHPPALEVPKTIQEKQQPEASLRHQSMEESILKLEEQMRQQILKMGDASTVSTDLKNKLHQIVTDNSNGIALHQLPLVYKKTYGEELPLAESGFVNVSELVGALSDVLCVNADSTSSQEETGRGQLIVKQTSGTLEKTAAAHQQHQHSSGELAASASAWDAPSKEDHMDHVEVFTQRKVNKTIQEVLPPVPVAAAAVPLDLVLNQRLKAPVRRKERELMSVVVEHTKTPGHFYLRFEGPEARLLEDMMLQMRTFYTCPEMSQRHKLLDVFVRPGQVCCVSPQSIWCYRVVILQVLDRQQVEVYYADFGDVSVVDRDRLCFLKACYATLPAQAVPSSLSGIRPVQGLWTAGAIGTFQKMCSGRLLVGAIDSYRHGFMQVYLCDTSTQEDKYAHSTLLTEGHAVACAKADYLETSCKSNPVSMYFGPGELQPVKMPECWRAVKISGNAPSNQEKLTVSETETEVMVDSATLVTALLCNAAAVESAALCDVPDVPSVEESAPLPEASIPQPEVSTIKSVPPAGTTLPSVPQSGTLFFESAPLPENPVLDPANCSNNPVLDSQPQYPSMPTVEASTLHPPPSTTEGAVLVAPPQINVCRITKDDVQVNVNPFEALLRKDFMLCSEWDKGWQQGHNGSGEKASTNVDTPKNVVLPAPVPGVDSHQLEQPATPEPLPQDFSPPTPSYIPTTLAPTAVETRSTGVEAPVSPGLLFPMMSAGARLSPDKLFLHHASPLALRPATRMAGGLNFLKW